MKKAKIRIMVADDHAIVRDGIVSIVAGEKDLQLVAQAANGIEAMELVKKHLPDILLLDLRMPGKDGLEVLRWIREQPLENLCVVVLSSANSAKEADEAMELGANAHLSKQWMCDASAAEIREIVENAYDGAEPNGVGISG